MSLPFVTQIIMKVNLTISFSSVSYHCLPHHLSSFYKIVFIQTKYLCRSSNYKLTSVLNWCHKASVKLSRYSEEFIYTNIVGDMGESNVSINSILLEIIDKEIPINFSLPTTPIKDTPSISKNIYHFYTWKLHRWKLWRSSHNTTKEDDSTRREAAAF